MIAMPVYLFLIAIPIIEANVVSVEIFLSFFITLGICFLTSEKSYSLFFASLSFGFSCLFSFLALPFILGTVIYLIVTSKRQKEFAKFILYISGCILPLVLMVFYLLSAGIFRDFLDATFLHPFSNLGKINFSSFWFFSNNLLVRTIILIVVLYFACKLNVCKKIGNDIFLLSLWTVMICYSVLFFETRNVGELPDR